MYRRDFTTVAVLLFCIFGSLLFLAVLKAGEAGMCRYTSEPKQPAYCEAGR